MLTGNSLSCLPVEENMNGLHSNISIFQIIEAKLNWSGVVTVGVSRVPCPGHKTSKPYAGHTSI